MNCFDLLEKDFLVRVEGGDNQAQQLVDLQMESKGLSASPTLTFVINNSKSKERAQKKKLLELELGFYFWRRVAPVRAKRGLQRGWQQLGEDSNGSREEQRFDIL